jgi:hypothetical protein
MTMGEGWNSFLDWTADSKAVLFTSDRNGTWEIFRQRVGESEAQRIIRPPSWAIPIVGFFAGIAGGIRGVQASPDGRWILYLANPDQKSVALMRVPVHGGMPEHVADVAAETTISCAKATTNFCTIAERAPGRDDIVFTAINPAFGRGTELARINLGPEPYGWALSEDGSKIAVHSERSSHFDLLSTTTGERGSLNAGNWSFAGPVSWNAHGDGLFASALSGPDAVALDIGLNGQTRVIWREAGDFGLTAAPSPDGRLVAFTQWRNNSNLWMMDNF